MNMTTVMIILGACLILLIGASWNLSRQEDSNLKKLISEINFEKGERSKLQKQVNEMNTQIYNINKTLVEAVEAGDKDVKRLEKEIRDLEFHVLKPRAINVTLTKPLEIKTVEPIKVRAGVTNIPKATAKITPAKKKPSREKSLKR